MLDTKNLLKRKFPKKTHPVGLLEVIQPLINQIAELSIKDSNADAETLINKNVKSFVTNAPVALLFLDQEKKILAHSEAWVKWFKQYLITTKSESEDFIGQNFLKVIHPCPKQIYKLINSTYKGKKKYREILEFKAIKSTRFIRWESFQWPGIKGEPKGILIFCEDITKRHLLALSNKKLQECNIMLERFAIIFSHDLVQPMRQINNYLNLLTSHISKLDTDKEFSDFALNAINKSMSQIRNLSEGIVLCCKNGDLTIDPEIVSLFRAIEEVRETCLLTSRSKLEIEIEQDVRLYANRICISQLLQNLITNAVKYSPPDCSNVKISGHKLESGYYEITIHNNGPFPVHYLKKFKTQSLSSSLDGTGLGLIICKKIVAAYKGNMSIESSVNKGTTVKISLPMP